MLLKKESKVSVDECNLMGEKSSSLHHGRRENICTSHETTNQHTKKLTSISSLIFV